MKTQLILVGGCAVLAGVAVLAAVRGRTQQPNNPIPRTVVSVAKEEQAPANPPIESVDLIPIVHLEMQNKLVTVQSGPAGLVYLVKANDGTIIHEHQSAEQLKAQAPEIHDLIKTAVAGSASKDNSFLDASLGK